MLKCRKARGLRVDDRYGMGRIDVTAKLGSDVFGSRSSIESLYTARQVRDLLDAFGHPYVPEQRCWRGTRQAVNDFQVAIGRKFSTSAMLSPGAGYAEPWEMDDAPL